MKKVLFLFVSTLVLGLTSCNKDDDSSSASIEGKWAYSQWGIGASGQEAFSNYENDCASQGDYIEFVSGGTATDHYFNSSCEDEATSGTWAKEGNTLTLTIDGETETAEIITLDGSTLKVKYSTGQEGMDYISVFTRM
ncbi:lipocalin family protein [Flavobacterium sp. U410]|jgi:hypothetical protein